MKTRLFICVYICLILSACCKQIGGVTLSLPLNVYPTSDTLHLGDTLWVTADFSSQIPLRNGDFFNADGMRLKLYLKIFVIPNQDIEKYISHETEYSFLCNDGVCKYVWPILTTTAGTFILHAMGGRRDAHTGDHDIFKTDKHGHTIESLSFTVYYKFVPYKQEYYKTLKKLLPSEFNSYLENDTKYAVVVVE